MTTLDLDRSKQDHVAKLSHWWWNPDKFVEDHFGVTPDAWQRDTLQAFPHKDRIAMKASKGPGKTATLAWLCWNYLVTRPFPSIAATSISGANLKSGLWKEMAYWQMQSPFLMRNFTITSTAIFNKAHPLTWVMYAKSWQQKANKEEVGETLAGLHQPYLLFVLDEAGGMPPEILLSAEAGFSSANTKECHIVMAGNTNSLQGALYHACVKHKGLWHVVVITGDPDDPKRSPRIPLEWAKEQIKQYGRENPFIKVTILGEWPASSFNALIGPDEVEASMRRMYREFQFSGAGRVLGIDVARFGPDASVIFPRQGIQAFPPQTLRSVDSITGAGAVARKYREWEADAAFIDMTGGYGAGWYDQLHLLGIPAIGVEYAGSAHQKMRFVNKRAEMYFEAVEWIKNGGALPECPELLAALPETNYTFQGDRFILEPKEDITDRLGFSPDHADAFVNTFAEPVNRKRPTASGPRAPVMVDYDPFASMFEVSKE